MTSQKTEESEKDLSLYAENPQPYAEDFSALSCAIFLTAFAITAAIAWLIA